MDTQSVFIADDISTQHIVIRVKATLKDQFSTFSANRGETANGLLMQLIDHCIAHNVIPFSIDFSMDSSPTEDKTIRKSIRIDTSTRLRFRKTCLQVGVDMSTVLRMFMIFCVQNGDLPF